MSSQTGSGSGILRKSTHGTDEDFRLTSHDTPGSGTEPPSSPQHSVRSSSVKRERHWLMKEEDDDGDLPVSSVDGSAVISSTAMGGSASISKHSLMRCDSHSEFDRYMRDLKALESATFERLTELDKTMKAYIDEAASRLQGQLSRTVLQQTESERRERAEAVVELRGEICDQGKRHTQAVGQLRKEIGTCQSDIAELVRQRHQATPVTAPQDPSIVWTNQVSELEKTLAHLHVAHQTQHENHKTQVEDVQREFKAELSKELHALRSDAQQNCSLLEAHLEKMRMAEDTSKALATRIDEMRRTIVDFQQDALSEMTVLRRRVEQVAGDSDAQAQQVPSLRRLVERHENQRVADSNRLVEQLQMLEKRLDESVSATRRHYEADAAPVLFERVRLVEASVREAMTGTRSLEMTTKSYEQAVADVRRQMTSLETVLNDLRSGQKALRDQQEASLPSLKRQIASLETVLTDLRSEQQALRDTHEADRSAHKRNSVASKADLHAELDGFDAKACDAKMKSMEDITRSLESCLDETRQRYDALVSKADELAAQRAEVWKILDEDRHSRALERRSFLERLQLVEQQLGSVAAERLTPTQVPTSPSGGSASLAPPSVEVPTLIERVKAAEANAHRAPLVVAQNLEVTRSLMENERRMLLDRIEPLEQRLASAGGIEAMAQRLSRVEQQCSVKTVQVHASGAAAADAAGGSVTLIPRLEALESTCKALQHLNDKNAKNNIGISLEAARTQQGFSQLRSNMESMQELLQNGLEKERADWTKATQEAKKRVDECFEAYDCRLAGIVNCRIGDTQSEPSETRAIDRGYARRVVELDAELRSEMANKVRTLTMELRGEIMGEVAVRMGSAEARMELLETRVTGDVRRNCTDLGIRIDRVEDEVKKNAKLVVELEERTTGTAAADAIEAIERDIQGALQDANPKHGSARSWSPPMRSASAKSLFHSHSHHPLLAPVDSIAADLRSSERSGSTTDAEGRASVRLASPDLSNLSYLSLTASHHAWQPPLVPTGETSLADEDLKNIQDGESPLSDGLKQSLQGLVSAVHRTFPKKDATARPDSARTSSARITDKKEDESAGKVVSPSTARSTGGSTCSPLLEQFRAAQELPVVTNMLDSEPASTESLAMRSTGHTARSGSSATPSIMSRMLAQQRNSRQTLGSMKDTALRQRISTMEVEAPRTGRLSPKLPSGRSSPAIHERLPISSSPMQQRPLANSKASLADKAQEIGTSWPGTRILNGVVAAATVVKQPDGVNYQPTSHQPRLSLSRYLSQ